MGLTKATKRRLLSIVVKSRLMYVTPIKAINISVTDRNSKGHSKRFLLCVEVLKTVLGDAPLVVVACYPLTFWSKREINCIGKKERHSQP